MPGGVYGQFANGVLAGVAQSAGLNPQELKIGVPVTNSHLKAERAVADNKKVVIFFQNPRALDDRPLLTRSGRWIAVRSPSSSSPTWSRTSTATTRSSRTSA